MFFFDWIALVNPDIKDEIINIDGKTLRRSHDSKLGQSAIHMASAWATKAGLTLGQAKTDDKSNEITAKGGGFPRFSKKLPAFFTFTEIDSLLRNTDNIIGNFENSPFLENWKFFEVPNTQKQYISPIPDASRTHISCLCVNILEKIN